MKALLLRLGLMLCLCGVFITAQAADYYWVGGSGNWSDLSHWVTTSGGTVGHTQVPTADDNVFFDAASFNTATDIVTLNSDNIFFNDMTWNQAIAGVSLVGGSNVTMSVYGAFVLSPGMIYDFAGDIVFNSDIQVYQDITVHGFRLAQNVRFDSRDGQWTFTHNAIIDSIFQIQDGIVSIEPDVEVSCEFLRANADEAASLILEGNLLVSGQDHRSNNINYKAVEIYASRFALVSSTSSTITLTNENTTFLVVDGTELLINYLDFTNPNGTAIVSSRGQGPNIVINRISFSSNGIFEGLASVMELLLAPSKTYTWQAGVDYNIEILTAIGGCSTPINLLSDTPGQATFFNNSDGAIGPITGEYLNIKDIVVSSGTFEVNNSLDLGNTAGWIINERASQDLFWVGGNGNWDDPMHWSATSGGAGGMCIPSINDNVFFDTNSFGATGEVCTVNIDDAFCKDFNWDTGALVADLFSNEKNLHIGGSLLLNSNMNWNLNGNIYFESNDPINPQIILTSGNTLNDEIWITGSGVIELGSDLKLINVINHEFGTFRTNNFDLETRGYLSINTNNRVLSLGSSTWTMVWDDNFASEFRLEGDNCQFDAGTSTLYFAEPGSFAATGENKMTFNRVIFATDGSVSTFGANGIGVQRIKYLEVNLRNGFFGSFQVDTLNILPGTVFTLRENETNQVDYLRAIGTCDQPISLRSMQPGSAGIIETNSDNSDIQYAFVQDWHTNGTGSFVATSSLDLGNNTGWTLINNAGRTLYWVGDSGDWSDITHWSLTSGGPGGECIPTPIDSVFFDENSFSVANQIVTGGFTYFKNMDWSRVDEQCNLGIDQSFAYGSIVLSDLSLVNYWNFVSFRGGNPDGVIDFKNQRVNIIQFEAGLGDWIFLGNVDILFELRFLSGKIDFGDSEIIASRIQFGNGANLEIDFNNSIIDVTGEAGFVHPIVSYLQVEPIINPGNGLILLSSANTGIDFNQIGIPLNSVRFTNPDGLGEIRNNGNVGNTFIANQVQFDGDGLMNSESNIGTLIFAPGKSYQLKSDATQFVHQHLQIVGNNCSSIELTSTQVGVLADLTIDDFEVVGDFIQMRDIRMTNAEASYAGIHSTDIGNSNVGWIFEGAPDQNSAEEGFFGDDQVLCENSTILLEAYPFNTDATFQWQDNSTDEILEVSTPGEYWARVTFGGGCSIIDTISILPQEDFAVALGNDTTLCDMETLLLDVSVAGATYLWQDGSEEDQFMITEAGQYFVDVNLGGCNIQDTIIVGYVSFADINLGPDQTLCESEAAAFDVTVPGGSYLWQDGSTLPTFSTTIAGTYYVDVTTDNCTATDTIVVSVTTLLDVNLGNDTTICDGTLLDVDALVLADSYSWSNGSSDPTTSLDVGEQYIDVTLDGCVASDTIVIASKPFPEINLGTDTVLCVGETFPIDLSGIGDSYIWQDGSEQAIFNISATGTYDVIVGLDGCVAYDTVDVTFNAFPILELGNDTTVCEGEELILELPTMNLTDALWSNGTANAALQASVSGQYYLDAYNGRCLTSDTVNLAFNPRPVFDLGADMIQCLGQPLDVDASVPSASYLWSDGSTQAMNSFINEGGHWVDVTLDGCTIRDSVLLQYIQIPDASLGRDTLLCEGDFLSYDFSNLNLSFEWSDSSVDPMNVLDEAGTYWLEVTDRDCASRDSITLLYKPSPSVDLGRDTMLCVGEEITLLLAVAADEIVTWSDNSNGDRLLVESSGSYTVQVDKDGCVVNDEIIITFNDPPNFDLGQDTLICEQQPLLLQPGIAGATYRWQDGSAEASYSVDRPGFYEVEVTKDGCSGIDNISIDTRVCTFYRAYLPEVFSPNGDGINDTYQPGFPNGLEITSYTMTVYDRWGNQLFISEDPLIGWDGTFNQTSVNRGTYIYTISVGYIDDRGPGSKLQRGEVLLMR